MKKLTPEKIRRKFHKKAWDLHSKVVRMKAKGQCYTCPDKRDWKLQNAGHFKHKDCLDFDPIAIQCQCVRCNKWLSGNLGEFAIRLVKEYGMMTVDEIRFRANQIKKFTREELEDFIDKYNAQLEVLKNETED